MSAFRGSRIPFYLRANPGYCDPAVSLISVARPVIGKTRAGHDIPPAMHRKAGPIDRCFQKKKKRRAARRPAAKVAVAP
ncbi:protein of unknown function [uncultured Sphingopyxis sp.]|uniref:Uncharacterized protein n=1 Tax=uncultured Sphingopyxis sp. TaxID=310581 RepID=A0A1Y5PPI9_9SPHN|nr:protein of unknown function [uncultured Sphingopyxis sp.]